jgi:formate hydrogenlyase subunit 6/NADH:ubiquinone oxidoreductase subunit I
METAVIAKPDFQFFIRRLIENHHVEGVKRKGQSVFGQAYFYGPIEHPDEICLDFDCTAMPPKKYFLPPREELLHFTTQPTLSASAAMEIKELILIGVHPYDIKAITQMDLIFSRGTPDPHYLQRRNAVCLIGVEPTRVAPRAFWASMGAASVDSGFDLMLTDIGGHYVVESRGLKGEDLLSRYAQTRPATAEEISRRERVRADAAGRCRQRGLTVAKEEIPLLLEKFTDAWLWEEKSGKCLSCGTCNLVCPTCYCFDVWDELTIDLVQGKRLRRWDGCLLQDFAKVSSGENFRETRTSRYQHRFLRKGCYLLPILRDLACVGCGRCASACLADIADPVDVFNRLKEETHKGEPP